MSRDNTNLNLKLSLRRHLLDAYHGDSAADVLDCCQGEGLIWKELRKEYEVKSYWGLDLKPKKGRLKIDSVRLLSQSGWTQNVIDIDTYGSPWSHWIALLPNLRHSATVFLTHGKMGQGVGNVDSTMLRMLGLGEIRVPRSIAARLASQAVPYLLAQAHKYDILIRDVLRVWGSPTVSYYGIRLECNHGR